MIGGVLAGYAINPLITLGAGAIGQMCIRDRPGTMRSTRVEQKVFALFIQSMKAGSRAQSLRCV